MIIKKKKVSAYHVIVAILGILAFASFFIALTNFREIEPSQSYNKSVNVGTITTYLKFLPENKNQTILQIALHNFGLALITFILSLLSCGILGVFHLCSAFFVGGAVIRSVSSLPEVAFVVLELIGMVIAVFGGAYIFNQRKKNNMSLKKVCIISLCFTLCLLLIYLLAAYIETGLIQNLWW